MKQIIPPKKEITFAFAVIITDDYGQTIHTCKTKRQAEKLYKELKKVL